MKNATTMYRTITATMIDTKGILCPASGEETIARRTLTYLYDKDFQLNGAGIAVEGGAIYYPAIVGGTKEVTYKCTMTETDFIKYSKPVDSRFVNGRTRMVTRNVKSYVAVCMVFSMKDQKMKTGEFALPYDMNKEKALTYVKRVHEDTSIEVIAMVQEVKTYEGIRAMTEKEFFNLSAREEVIE